MQPAASLYHNVLLLECADGHSMAEALACLPGRAAVWRISETVMALDPTMVDEVLARLKRAGITARIVEP